MFPTMREGRLGRCVGVLGHAARGERGLLRVLVFVTSRQLGVKGYSDAQN